jgi:hypothetical protein
MEKSYQEPTSENQPNSLEKLTQKYWEYFDAKWELQKTIQNELQKPNSAFLDTQKADDWKEQKRQEFTGLLKDDTTLDRVVDRLCEQLPQFVENKQEYEENPRYFVDNLIRQSLSNDNFDPDIFDQLQNREAININFDRPPNMVITIDGQHDSHLIHSGKFTNGILRSGWVDKLGIWIEKYTGGQDNTLLHEKFHKESRLQSINKFGQYQHQSWYSSIPYVNRKFDLPKIIQNYTNGGLMMEEILASFTEGNEFDQWQLKYYLVDYIDNENYEEFEDIPEHEKVFEDLNKTRKLILQSLQDFLPIVMQRTGLSELEARQYIANALSVYYDGSAITDIETYGKRIVNTRSIPKILSLMSTEIKQ